MLTPTPSQHNAAKSFGVPHRRAASLTARQSDVSPRLDRRPCVTNPAGGSFSEDMPGQRGNAVTVFARLSPCVGARGVVRVCVVASMFSNPIHRQERN